MFILSGFLNHCFHGRIPPQDWLWGKADFCNLMQLADESVSSKIIVYSSLVLDPEVFHIIWNIFHYYLLLLLLAQYSEIRVISRP